MLPFLKTLCSRSKSLNALMGDVLMAQPREHGALSHSFFEWRVKRSFDGERTFVAIAMRPDGYAGREGAPTNYINFDIETAIRLRAELDECIEFARRQSTGTKPA